jgi:hypothetical protein
MSTNDPEKLEASIHRLLRSLPDRKAPAGLEARVLGELGRRASLPWWHRSYAYWPSAVRVAFFVGSAIAAALIVAGLFALGHSSGANALSGGVAERLSWLVVAREIIASTNARILLLIRTIPSVWLYSAVGTVALCYAALGAIGAATYRALTFARQTF